MTPQYICFEGIDGSGKSSQIELLALQLFSKGITPIKLCEPSYGPFGREARRRMADGSIGSVEEQRKLFTADRVDHVKRKIEPLLAFVRQTPGFAILQSRSYLSAPAYQADRIDRKALEVQTKRELAITPAPDMIVVLDIPAKEAVRRVVRDRRPDLFEDEGRLEAVRQRYEYLAQITPKCVLIEAMGDIETVNRRVCEALGPIEEGGMQ